MLPLRLASDSHRIAAKKFPCDSKSMFSIDHHYKSVDMTHMLENTIYRENPNLSFVSHLYDRMSVSYIRVCHCDGVFKFTSYPQSGAGHQRQSGSATSHLLSMNSSYLSMSARSPRIMRMSCGLKRSEHSGQLMLTRDSEISMRRYWRRQSMQERW